METFETVDDSSNMTSSNDSLVLLFITLTKLVLTFERVDEIFECIPSNESFRAVYFSGFGGKN